MKLALPGIAGLVVAGGFALSCGGLIGGNGSDKSGENPRSPDAAEMDAQDADRAAAADGAQAESLLDANGTSASGDAQTQVDAGPTDALAPDAAETACRDDSPPSGAPFLRSGSSCTLPDGGMGYGSGAYGCVDPTVCRCSPAAGDLACVQMPYPNDKLTFGACIYASCNGANQNESCRRPDGTIGSCCLESCRKLDTNNDPNNCGGCGFACAPGLACVSGQCGDCGAHGFCPCPGVGCPVGRVCAAALCNGGTCSACVQASCGAEPDGTRCAISTDAGGRTGAVLANYDTGICCNHECVDPQSDARNCGGCRTRCCSGTHCSPVGDLITAECL